MTDTDLTWRPVDFEFRVNPEPDGDAWNAALELVSQWAERHGLSLIGFASQAANDDGETFRTVRDQRDALAARIAAVEALHRPDGPGRCDEPGCPPGCVECGDDWPCATVRALAV